MQWSELALFARDFQRGLAPLRQALEAARASLADASEESFPRGEELAASLASLGGELGGLLERVAAERSSIFVFGPAKAGKSTLIDALAGARVSPASILPSYPCLRRVRHALRLRSTLSRFDGSTQQLEEPGAQRLVLQRAHGELVTRVRATRAQGEAFDPARHFPQAVRLVERSQPVAALESGALELVECPPIHASLFPAYGEMLIGEPDHARAGLFVVRAAQLADDAVFDGIEELLAAFERLILVINLDERARELSPDGELAPGPEREDPARLVAAFEELSICESLASAVRSGRVPVLALDLLEAARTRLHGAEEGPAAPGRFQARFGDLTREVSAVLDSHEVFQAMVASAARRAVQLCEELRELADTPGLGELAQKRETLAREHRNLVEIGQALERLAARTREPWEAEELFDGLRSRLAAGTSARAAELARDLEGSLARALEDWFANGSSLESLLDAGLAPRLESARNELVRSAERLLREERRRVTAATALTSEVRADLARGRIEFERLLARSVERVQVHLEPLSLRPLDVEAIPVRPRLGQRLTLRGASEIRRALFGPPEAPANELSSADKARRLGSEARAAMQRSAGERALAILDEEARRIAGELHAALLTEFLAGLQQQLAAGRQCLTAPLRELEARAAALAALEEALVALAPASARAEAELAELTARAPAAGTLVPAPRAARGEAAGARRGVPAFD